MTDFEQMFRKLALWIWERGEEVEVGEWQSQDVRDKPHMVSREVTHTTFRMAIPFSVKGLQHEVKPNLPWAEDHFLERVSGIPFNPPPSEAWWPFAVQGNAEHKEGERFSHTYPERIWPKKAGWPTKIFKYWTEDLNRGLGNPSTYPLGDLDDVVELLAKNPQTRQAYLPIWFPQDTGARLNQRVPCTIGYHFLVRKGRLDVVYYIRSCDLLRHFSDDVYMAARLGQWVVGKLRDRHGIELRVNELIMHISSLHYFRGDYPRIEQMIARSSMDDDDEEGTYGAPV